MKIELDVDPGNLAKSVNEILATLTPEQKLDIAKQTMEKWLKEPYDFERQVKEREVIDKLKGNRSSYRDHESEEQIRKSYEFSNAMSGFKSSKEVMLKTISEGILESYKAEIKKTVESDPKIQAMKEEVIAIIKETFPKSVHDAMVQWMASSMNTMFNATMGMDQAAENSRIWQQRVQDRLGQFEGRMSSRGM